MIFFPFLTLNLFLVIMSLSLSFLPFPLPSFSHSHDRALGAFARREAFLTYLLANQHKQPAVVSRIRSILSSPMPIVSKSVPAPEAGEDEVFTAQMHRFCEFMLRGQAEPVAGYPQLSAFAPGWNLKKDEYAYVVGGGEGSGSEGAGVGESSNNNNTNTKSDDDDNNNNNTNNNSSSSSSR